MQLAIMLPTAATVKATPLTELPDAATIMTPIKLAN